MNTILAQKHCERAVDNLEQVLRTVPVYQERQHRQYLQQVVADIVAAAVAEVRAEMMASLQGVQEMPDIRDVEHV